MKRFIAAILCVGLIAAISTGCAYKDALSKDNTATTQATEAAGSVATEDEVDAKNFSDNLQGLSEYFAKKGYKLPTARKTGTTIAGVVYKVSGDRMRAAATGTNYRNQAAWRPSLLWAV